MMYNRGVSFCHCLFTPGDEKWHSTFTGNSLFLFLSFSLSLPLSLSLSLFLSLCLSLSLSHTHTHTHTHTNTHTSNCSWSDNKLPMVVRSQTSCTTRSGERRVGRACRSP